MALSKCGSKKLRFSALYMIVISETGWGERHNYSYYYSLTGVAYGLLTFTKIDDLV